MAKYSPRDRVKRFQQGFRLTENRMSWARVAWGTVALMYYPDDEPVEETHEEGVQTESTEPGPTIRLVIKKNNSNRPVTLDLTMLTAEELDCLGNVLELAIKEARPVCELRDKEAQKQHAEGDDSNTRVYRPVPQFVVRERPSGKHSEGVRDGSEGLPGGDGDGTPDRDVRGTGDAVADPEPGDGESEDDGS